MSKGSRARLKPQFLFVANCFGMFVLFCWQILSVWWAFQEQMVNRKVMEDEFHFSMGREKLENLKLPAPLINFCPSALMPRRVDIWFWLVKCHCRVGRRSMTSTSNSLSQTLNRHSFTPIRLDTILPLKLFRSLQLRCLYPRRPSLVFLVLSSRQLIASYSVEVVLHIHLL